MAEGNTLGSLKLMYDICDNCGRRIENATKTPVLLAVANGEALIIGCQACTAIEESMDGHKERVKRRRVTTLRAYRPERDI